MAISDIHSIEFWAREHMLPLFWLTDPRHTSVGDGTLFLYKDEVVHCYYVNERIAEEHRKGYDYFSKAENFEGYIAEANVLMQKMHGAEQSFSQEALSGLSIEDLFTQFDGFLSLLGEFSDHYTKTEAEKLKKFEDVQDEKIQESLFKVGKTRFALRASVESLFTILLGHILQEVAQRFGIESFDLFFYTYQEIRDAFAGKLVLPEVITSRKNGYALLNIHQTSEILIDESFEQAWKMVETMTAFVGTELKGRSAYPGTVRGIVELVLHNSSDLVGKVARFTEGHILVTEMTTPETVIACKKAIAIITDEGGILCHAAIISRELAIPCIVGTKVATQILKDGDEVEVDAENGTVKIIKQI